MSDQSSKSAQRNGKPIPETPDVGIDTNLPLLHHGLYFSHRPLQESVSKQTRITLFANHEY